MPAYNVTTPKPISAIYPGDVQTVWDAESPLTADASVEVALAQSQVGAEFDISVSLLFSGAPGTFAVDLQTADIDADANYVTVLGATLSAVTANFAANYQAHVRANFARLLMKDNPANAVTITASIGR